MKNNRLLSRLIALMLSLILTAVSIPSTIIAEQIINEEGTQTESTNNNEENNSSALIEDLSKRDRFTKHYVSPDGSRYAVIFSEQVHYNDGENWQDVDNRLTLNTDTQRYCSANSVFSVDFAANTAADSLASISDGEYTLSWSVLFQNSNGNNMTMSATATAQIINNGEASSSITVNNMESMGKATSALKYNGLADGNVDIRYTVLHGKVEEDIIINSLGNFASYALSVNTGGLTVTVDESGKVLFLDVNSNVIFSIAAPWMMDANGEISNNIEVNSIQKGDFALIIYTPSREWLADTERTYPVLIDPAFTTRFYTNNYTDTYTYSGDSASTSRPTETTMKVGIDSDETEYYSYIKILNIPRLSDSYNVTNAVFKVYSNDVSSPKPLSLHHILEHWNTDIHENDTTVNLSDRANTLSFDTQPGSTTIIENVIPSYDPDESVVSTYSFNITSWLNTQFSVYGKNFLSSNSWHGFKLSSQAPNYVMDVYSSEHSWAGYRPTLTIGYTFTPDECLVDGAVYKFKNSLGKYMTVANGDNVGQNVYAHSEYEYNANDEIRHSQEFRLKWIESNNSFVISTIRENAVNCSGLSTCSNTNCDICNPLIVKFDYYSAFNQTTGYIESNVYRGSYSSSTTALQDWIIECVDGMNKYKIVSRSDPNIALKKLGGISEGEHSSLSVYTDNNIVVGKYTGSGTDLWNIEAGGLVLNHQMQNFEGVGSLTSSSNDLDISFFMPVYYERDTVTFTASNSSVATVDDNGKLSVTGIGVSNITATVTHADNSTDSYFALIDTVVVGAGEYIIRNSNSTSNYLNISIPDNSTVPVTNFEYFDTADSKRWIIEYNPSDPYYYYIRSASTDLYLGVDSNDSYAVKFYSSFSDYTRWKIERISFGTYKLICKATESQNLALSKSSSGNLIQANQNDAGTLWHLFEVGAISDTIYEEQLHSMTCWAASARMFARNYRLDISKTQDDAVSYVKNGFVNEGGSSPESIKAINYYLSDDPAITLDISTKSGVYSSEVLKMFFDDGHIIYATLRRYEKKDDNSILYDDVSHAVIVAGYVLLDGQYFFIKYDPWYSLNVFQIEIVSHDVLCDENKEEGFDALIFYLWYASIVVNTSYANNTEPWHYYDYNEYTEGGS